MHPQSYAISIGWRRPIWIALLVAASIAFTLGFACATPFAAFAAAASLTMNCRNAQAIKNAASNKSSRASQTNASPATTETAMIIPSLVLLLNAITVIAGFEVEK